MSLEDSDEKPGSAGNNLHLRSSSQGYGRAPCDDQHSSHSEMQMTSQAMTGSDSLLSAMSSVPLMLQNAKRQMTMIGGTGNHGHDHSIYQQHLHVQVRCSLECC